MENLKEELVQLIQAYAMAMTTSNQRLIGMAGTALSEKLESVEISAKQEDASEP